MAIRMNLAKNQTGLTEIMNVSKKVGSESDCLNLPNDVEAVQKLFNIFLPTTSIFKFGFGLVPVNGKYDALLGFYIFKIQRGGILRGFKNDVVDGCISPASSFGYGAATEFTIVAINRAANDSNAGAYKAFMSSFVTR